MMKKNLIVTLSAVVVLIALIVAYAVVFHMYSDDDATDVDDIFGTTEYLWDEKAADVISVAYNMENGNYTINADDGITIDGYDSIIISSYELTQAVSKAALIPVKRFLEVDSSDFAKYGFDYSQNTVTLTMKDGRVRTLVLGHNAGVRNEVYALDKENGVVCTISSEYASMYRRHPSEYRSKILCTLSNVFVREVTVHKGSRRLMTIKGVENGSSYVMEYPYAGADVSKTKMQDFMANFNQLEADDVVEENPADISAYGFDNALSVYIYDSAEKHTFRFGDMAPEGGMYIMCDDRPVVYRGTCFLYEYFKDVQPVDYLEPYVHLYSSDTVSSVEISRDGTAYLLEISGEGDETEYLLNSKSLNEESFRSAYRAVSAMHYGDVVSENGGSKLYFRVVFRMKDGSVNQFDYYDYNKDYCVVRSSAGVNCKVLKSVVDNALKTVSTLAK